MKHYSPTGRRNHGRPLKRLLDTWYRNGSTSGKTPWKIDDDDDYYDYDDDKQLTPQGRFGLCCWRCHTVEQTPIEKGVSQRSIDCITRSNIRQTITPSPITWRKNWLQLIRAKT
jgi:hypothetical protein